MPAILSRCCFGPSMYTPNSVGLSGQPCLTIQRHLKISEIPSDVRAAALLLLYMDLMFCSILPLTPSSSNTCHNRASGTLSNAFLKSTKQQNSLPDPDSARLTAFACQSALSRHVMSVVRKAFTTPACRRASTLRLSAHLAILCSHIFAKSLASTDLNKMPR